MACENNKKTLYIVHGNIASGKTTLINYLEGINYQVKREDFSSVRFVNALNNIYNDEPDSHFELQKLIIDYWKEFIYSFDFSCNKLILDRSPFDSMLFIIVNRAKFNELQYSFLQEELRSLDEEIRSHFDHVKHIYVKNEPVVSKLRSDMRNDNVRSIDYEYLAELSDLHDFFYKDTADLVVINNINGNLLYIQDVENYIIQN